MQLCLNLLTAETMAEVSNFLKEIELPLLMYLEPQIESKNADLISYIQRGLYAKALQTSSASEIFKINMDSDSEFDVALGSAVENYLIQGSKDRQLDVLAVGIACIQVFVQANWTGPPVDESSILDSSSFLKAFPNRECVCGCLVLDGESLAACIVLPHLLVAARAALCINESRLSDIKSSGWWCMRYLFLHQQILEEKSPIIYNSLKTSLKELPFREIFKENASNGRLKALFDIECALVYLYYFEVQKASECLQDASCIIGLDISLGGALGKRTRFQEKNIAQLTLNVKCESSSPQDDDILLPEHDLPKDLQLEDEVRLNQIKFLNSEDGEMPTLRPIEQAVIFGNFIHIMKSQPKDKLADEELMTYITCLLSQPRIWCMQFTVLLERCRLESNHSRTVERSMMQAQALVDALKSGKPGAKIRQKYFYSCRMPPSWKVEAELAHLFLSLGAVNSALEIYLRIQLWEEVIACYTILELRHKAVEIIEQQLEAQETVKMWCLLGDAKDDVECYKKAWELSKHKSARAQRHWGLYFYFKGNYEEAILHLQKSLDINSLQLPLWSRLGFSALSVENWELAAAAYRRYCSLDTENFEAWNNLAKAYIKSGQKARAWKALQEALKCNFENWKVWDNLMVVSTDCGEFDEVIRAYHRILDLKEKHVDTEVLEILVKAIKNNDPDNQGVPAGRLKPKALALFGRLTSQVTNNSKVWLSYANLTSAESDKSPETLTKVTQLLQKAHRSAFQTPNWEREIKSCIEVLEMSQKLADAYIDLTQNCPSNQIIQILSSAKLSLKGVIARIKQYHKNAITGGIASDISEPLDKLERKLEDVVSEISRHQS